MADWAGVDMTWTGADGSVWEPLDTESPVTLETVRGLHVPAWDVHTTQAPGMAGSRHNGSRAQAREVFWGMAVHTTAGTDAWLDVDRRWWRSLDPDTPGTWVVSAQGMSRSLQLRLVLSDDDMPRDPTLHGDLTYGITLSAEQPFWEGAPVRRLFIAPDDGAFFATSGGVITISPGNTLAAAAIDNPGDEPAWPVWTATGPFTALTVGLNGKTIVANVTASSTQALVIDTRPDSQSATRWSFTSAGPGNVTLTPGTDTDVVSSLTTVQFEPIQRGTSVPLTVLGTGTDTGFSVAAEITPLYRRAW